MTAKQNSQRLTEKKWRRLIEDFLEYLQIERNCSPLTIRNYRHYLERFVDWLVKHYPRLSVTRLNLETVKKYRVYLARWQNKKGLTLKRATQGYHVIALRAFLRYLARRDIKSLAPEKIEVPKGESQSLKFLEIEQVERLLTAPSISDLRGLRDKAILELLFSTGLRVSELVQLNRDQVNL
ncbi:MAG: site-specific integrase, partial [Cyanobacteriota bacterium]